MDDFPPLNWQLTNRIRWQDCLTSLLVGIKTADPRKRVSDAERPDGKTMHHSITSPVQLETAQSECKCMHAPNVKWQTGNTIWIFLLLIIISDLISWFVSFYWLIIHHKSVLFKEGLLLKMKQILDKTIASVLTELFLILGQCSPSGLHSDPFGSFVMRIIFTYFALQIILLPCVWLAKQHQHERVHGFLSDWNHPISVIFLQNIWLPFNLLQKILYKFWPLVFSIKL